MNSTKNYRLRILLIFICFALIYTLSVYGCIFLSEHIFEKKHDRTVFSKNAEMPTVIIDAGHGGEDGGAVGANGCVEKELNLSIAKKLYTLLRCAGIDTVMTRSEDILLYDRNTDYMGHKKELDLDARLKISQKYENAVFVSIHMNSFPIEKYSGLQVYYSVNDDVSKALAEKIQSITREVLMKDNKRTVKPTNGKIFLLDNASVPSVLIECGFLSNNAECARLCDESYQDTLATAIYCAICEHIGTP